MKKILVRGPALSRSGYGEQCRFALRALRAHEDQFDVHLINTGWGATGWLYEDTEEREWIDQTILKTIRVLQNPEGVFDMSLQVALPNEWQLLARTNIGYTAGVETDTVPAQWAKATEMMNKIIVPSNHTKSGFVSSGCDEAAFEVVNYPVRTTTASDFPIELECDFNFLTVAQWGPRKNMEATITSFLEEFTNEEVGLIIKTSIKNSSVVDREFCNDRLKYILDHFPSDRKCKVYLLHGNLTEEEMAGLYQNPSIKAYVSTSHGEGFGLPVFEACCNELPVITPNWGGVRDFCNVPVKHKKSNKTKNKPMIYEVKHRIENVQADAVWEGIIEPTSSWCFVELDSLRQRMREVYNKPNTARAKKLKKHLVENFSVESKHQQFVDAILSVSN